MKTEISTNSLPESLNGDAQSDTSEMNINNSDEYKESFANEELSY